ncbi:MAG: hypothetical protein ACFCBU_14380 [Cyanophyceae cyanobacterium]
MQFWEKVDEVGPFAGGEQAQKVFVVVCGDRFPGGGVSKSC